LGSVREVIRRAVIVASFVACGGTPPAPPLVTNRAPVVVVDAAVSDSPCMTECLEDPRLRPYCEERCAPVEEANEACGHHCRDSLGDDPTYEEVTACDLECATVPTVSSEAMRLCVEVCETRAQADTWVSEGTCRIECDPDPYDQCTYLPCD
jgi:hypothetical protein